VSVAVLLIDFPRCINKYIHRGVAVNSRARPTPEWCGIDPAPKQRRVEVCSFLNYFAKNSDHFPQAWLAAAAAAVAPANFKFDEGVLFITPNAKSVELRYHDYDAEVRAANGNQ
jgi:hypothetical protein